jgi:hypothetical protein
MKKRRVIFTLAGFLLIFCAWSTRTIVDYGATCARCLQHVKGVETWILGVRVSHKEVAVQRRGGLMSVDTFDPRIPLVDPSAYEKIFGQPCQHLFKRGGFGREKHFFVGSLAGDLSSPAGPAFSPRTDAIEALYRLNDRVKDDVLAKSTYAVFDRLFPPDTALEAALELRREFLYPTSKLATATSILNVIDSNTEWRTVLDYFNGDFIGPAPFITDAEFLAKRLKSSDPVLRRGCSAILTTTPSLNDVQLLAAMIDDPDEVVAENAAGSIINGRYFQLFGKVFRMRKPLSYRGELPQSFQDEEIVELFKQNDPVVDDFCLEAIAVGQRLQMLDVVVEQLNHRDSDTAKKTIAQLISGPNPLDGEGDPWERIEPLKLSVSELKAYVSIGTASKVRDTRKWQFLNAIKSLALQRDSQLWEFLNHAYLREVDDGVNETYGAVMARAMMELDASRTEKFLLTELKGENHRRLSAALAGIGLIASPVFADPIEEFRDHPPKASAENPYPPEHIFKNPAYSRLIDYALHRCRGIQNWSLLRNETGKYYIKRL